MRRILFTIFLSLFALSSINAQTNEIVNELTPVLSNIGKFFKNATLSNGKVKFAPKVENANFPDGKKGVAVTIQISYYELDFEDIGGKWTARMSFYGRITSKNKNIDGFFEETSVLDAHDEELINAKKNFVKLRKVFELPEGKYQIGIIVRDIISGSSGMKVIKFQIP